jgi:hypothetical protein
MKYLNSTAIKSFAICCQIILFTSIVQAQKTSNSPYSRYGIGLTRNASFNSNIGTGSVGYAWRPTIYKPLINDSLAKSNAKLNDRRTNYINLLNPASISNISLTTFETGLFSRNTKSTSNGQSNQANNTTISHIAVGFPVSEKIGMAFGLRQFSSVGYEYENFGLLNSNVLVTNLYEGSGGLNEVFVSGAYEYKSNLSLGFSAKYLFGGIDREKRVIYDNSTVTGLFNTLDLTETNVSSFSFDIGVQYFKNIRNDYRLVVGLVASPKDELSAEQSNATVTYTGNIDSESVKDSITSFVGKDITLPFASKLGGGFSFEKKGVWVAEFDFTNYTYDDYKIEENIFLKDSYTINVGFERFNRMNAFGSYFKRMGYRTGFRYNSSLINISGIDVSEMAVSAGLSMPLRKSFSTINFGIELGTRGEDSNGLTKENFFNILFGITINDKWFIQRKYD